MRVCSLASGSSGNCIYVGSDDTHILVDVGVSGKKTECGLAGIDLSLSDIDAIVDTAIAAQLMGKRLVYLEAGSGALSPVPQQVVQEVRHRLQIPLIVGGGIGTPEQMQQIFDAGADMVVIGNHFENHPEQFPLFVNHER